MIIHVFELDGEVTHVEVEWDQDAALDVVPHVIHEEDTPLTNAR